jgi:uncharacterized protein (TIGR02145 family)
MNKNLDIKTAESWCYGEGGQVVYGRDDDGNEIIKTLSSSEIQANCNKYGRLYTWTAAKKACPASWRLPDTVDVVELVTTVGGQTTAAKELKAKSGWNSDGNGTDNYRFSALPGGNRISEGYFEASGYYGDWWINAEYDSDRAWVLFMSHEDDKTYIQAGEKSLGFSVRCVKTD